MGGTLHYLRRRQGDLQEHDTLPELPGEAEGEDESQARRGSSQEEKKTRLTEVRMTTDSIDRARATQRAARCWELMDENEKAAVRFGMSPGWTTFEDLDGKAPGEGWEALQSADDYRLTAVALMSVAEHNGGMVV